MKKILIKYASKGRPELFKETIKNIYDTISVDSNFRIVVTADKSDKTMFHIDIDSFCFASKKLEIMYGISRSKIHAINRDMNNRIKPDWDILINMSDDMKFVVQDWDREIRNDMELWFPLGDGFLHYSDGFVGEKLPTMSIMDKKYYDRTNYIYYPGYQSFSCDAEAMYVAMMLGRHKYIGDNKVLFKHRHPANDKNIPNDETYRLSSLATKADEKLYWKRLNNYFDIPENERQCVPFQEFIGMNI